ncbi:18034_t:CDS:1, partial [Racocetra persica]
NSSNQDAQTQSQRSIAQQVRRECERIDRATNQRETALSNQDTQTQSQRSIIQQVRREGERIESATNRRVIAQQQ